MRPEWARERQAVMSNWRIVNPALEPARVEFETGDEQAALTQFAARDASLRGFKLLKSDDDGKTWAEVEARAPSAAAAPAASAPVDPSKGETSFVLPEEEKPKHDKREKASK